MTTNGNGGKVAFSRAQLTAILAMIGTVAGAVWFVADGMIDRVDERYDQLQESCEEHNETLLGMYQGCVDKLFQEHTRPRYTPTYSSASEDLDESAPAMEQPQPTPEQIEAMRRVWESVIP